MANYGNGFWPVHRGMAVTISEDSGQCIPPPELQRMASGGSSLAL